MKTFKEKLAEGQIGESAIAQWLRGRGWFILPVYEKEIDTGKGPRVFSPDGQIVAPDLLAFHPERGQTVFMEAKHKKVFSWRRNWPGPRWETGIDLSHWKEYLKLADLLDIPIYLLFLHRCSTPWQSDLKYGCPDACPTGLFLGEIQGLNKSKRADPTCRPIHRSGMVYWGVEDLRKLAGIEEFEQFEDAA